MINYLLLFRNKVESRLAKPDFLDKVYFPSLDGWRAIAIALVVLGHLKFNVQPDSAYFKIANNIIYAELGVRIFFVLSGFLITSLLIKEFIKKQSINIRHFFIKRTLRIFPALYLFLIVLAVLNYIFKLDIPLKGFIGAAFYLSNFFYFHSGWYTGHTWSLAVEEQFYLIWPFIFLYVKENFISFICFVLAVHIILKLFWWFYPAYAEFTLAPFLTHAETIFIGAMLSFLSFKGFFNTDYKVWKSRLLCFSGILSILIISFCMNKGHLGFVLVPFGSLAMNIIIGFLMLQTLINPNAILYKLLNTKIMINIGIISYSIYIWQQFFIVPVVVTHKIPYILIFPFNIFATFITAYISYHFFEKHFLKLKKQIK